MTRRRKREVYVPGVTRAPIHLGQTGEQAIKVAKNRSEEERLIAEVVENAKRNNTYGRASVVQSRRIRLGKQV